MNRHRKIFSFLYCIKLISLALVLISFVQFSQYWRQESFKLEKALDPADFSEIDIVVAMDLDPSEFIAV